MERQYSEAAADADYPELRKRQSAGFGFKADGRPGRRPPVAHRYQELSAVDIGRAAGRGGILSQDSR